MDSNVVPARKPEQVRDAVPMPASRVREIRMAQYRSNSIPAEVPAELTSGIIQSGTRHEK
jgi:hypothetical protein